MGTGTVVLAHGVGSRADLPIPVRLAVVGGGGVVLLSFLAMALLWPRSRLRGDRAGAPLPAGLQVVLDSPVLTVVLRTLTLAAAALCTAVALVGPQEAPQNLGVYAFYVTFWVGLVPASLLLGPVWARANPLRGLHWALAKLAGPAPAADRLDALGTWPAAGFVLVYAWLELAYPQRALPERVGTFLVLYAIVQLLAALWFGEAWFARGDAFEVYSSLLGRLSLWGRRRDGRLVVRNPLDGGDSTPAVRGLSGVVVALLASTMFDGITRTQWWQTGPGIAGDTDVVAPTLGLAVVVAAVGLVYWASAAAAGRLSGTAAGPGAFAHSLVPIAAGYAVAHYFSLLVLDGQLTWILASDPFRTGLDVLGTASLTVNYTRVSPRTISYVQVGAIVLGHVLGVVLAHDRAVRLVRGAAARRSQYPLVTVMVAVTCGGLALLLG